jgi:hypothetical protein
MKMAVFWVVEIALRVEAARTSETSVNFYQTTRRNNTEDSLLHSQILPKADVQKKYLSTANKYILE